MEQVSNLPSICAIWRQVVVINNYIVNLFSLQYFATGDTSIKWVANLFSMHDMAGGGKICLTYLACTSWLRVLFTCNTEYFFQYAQLHVSFSGGVIKLFAIYQLAVVEDI